ncbi:hypothetical protein EUA98_11225 [Pengzhenrongella frigida]|uniref:Asp23/Gls24 family envelope stress response protein n=2 Tax=Pengzhenrongella frigida TaxID=1259133 RepID=A0A4Q5MYP6_9MICO|nr:hypothetical protein EUA98_11225 [Cellulomonas sp. HLT2-17]
MAMTPQNAHESNEAGTALVSDARWAAAITASRAHTDARWVEISDRMRARALRVTRRSLPITAQAPSGPVHVSEQVLITYLRDALTAVPGARVDDIIIAVGAQDAYAGITVAISARYGEPLLPIADAMRDLAAARLRDLLGDITPPVTVTTMEVHIDDVLEA